MVNNINNSQQLQQQLPQPLSQIITQDSNGNVSLQQPVANNIVNGTSTNGTILASSSTNGTILNSNSTDSSILPSNGTDGTILAKSSTNGTVLGSNSTNGTILANNSTNTTNGSTGTSLLTPNFSIHGNAKYGNSHQKEKKSQEKVAKTISPGLNHKHTKVPKLELGCNFCGAIISTKAKGIEICSCKTSFYCSFEHKVSLKFFFFYFDYQNFF